MPAPDDDALDLLRHPCSTNSSTRPRPVGSETRDSFRPHPEIWMRARSLATQLGPTYLARRRTMAATGLIGRGQPGLGFLISPAPVANIDLRSQIRLASLLEVWMLELAVIR